MAKAKAKVTKTGSVGISLSPNAMFGILLAIIGAFLVFYNSSVSGIIGILSRVIGVFLICVGAVGVVNFIKRKLDAIVLVIGILEVVVGILLLIPQVSEYFAIVIACVLILYGAYYLFCHHKTALHFVTGILFVVIGILLMVTHWVSNDVYNIVVGVFTLLGAAYFLFVA